jgi:TetR/AcrR family transcriptional repressor of mexJK operon
MSAVPNRERVLRAATAAFLTDGYRSSVDRIAQRAGVAKQTVYSHFPSKDDLFKEVAREMVKGVLVELEAAPHDLRAGLVRFGFAYRRRILSDEGVATFRTLVPEIPRFRTLAKAMYAASAGETVRRLAQRLEAAMRAGTLRREEPQFAAELLLGMLTGQDRVKRLFCVLDRPDSDARHTSRIVDCFLRVYSVEGRS